MRNLVVLPLAWSLALHPALPRAAGPAPGPGPADAVLADAGPAELARALDLLGLVLGEAQATPSGDYLVPVREFAQEAADAASLAVVLAVLGAAAGIPVLAVWALAARPPRGPGTAAGSGPGRPRFRSPTRGTRIGPGAAVLLLLAAEAARARSGPDGGRPPLPERIRMSPGARDALSDAVGRARSELSNDGVDAVLGAW